MPAFLLPALAFAKRLPPWVYYAIAAIIVAGLLYRAGWNASETEADLAAAKADSKVIEQAREADGHANSSVEATRSTVEQTNDEARNAAHAGDDPLGDGLRSLRSR